MIFAGVNVGMLEVSAQAALAIIRLRNNLDEIIPRRRNCDVLLIDEVWMPQPVVLDLVEELALSIRRSSKLFGGIKLVRLILRKWRGTECVQHLHAPTWLVLLAQVLDRSRSGMIVAAAVGACSVSQPSA